ncbi:MAG TPA: OmpA family protein [Cytophagales bacterium]|nr:OmpA family protein [Cytophagales bacterium]
MRFTYFITAIIVAFTAVAQAELEATEDTALVHFSVADKKGIPEAHVKISVNSLDGKIKRHMTTDVSGKFDMLLPEGKKYKIIARKYGRDFDFDEILDIPVMEGTVEVDQNIVIHIKHDVSNLFTLNIHFESGKWELTDQAKAYIDEHVLALLNNDKNMKIEIAGHTDDVGDDVHNMKLSQLRANSVRDYLYSKGVAHDRVTAKGYGETHPLVPNTSSENRLKNRRIEAKVLKLEEKK